jgi:hypothetical protein
MLDLNHLPKTGNGNIDYFYSTGGSNSWVTWEKPRGIHTIVITCIGGGGGGRSGWCSPTITRNGGAGGGSGGFSRLLIPAMVLPDVLYIAVGRGGAGGASITAADSTTGMAGSNGTFSIVNIATTNNSIYTVCFANGGLGASTVTNGATNTAGTGAVIAAQSSANLSGLGQFFALAGQTGATGPTGNPTALSYPTTGLLLSGGGAGGGGQNNLGGNITAPTQASFSLITTRTGGTQATIAGPGADGLSLFQPLMSIGGAGGGSSSSVTSGVGSGGRGGNGGLGCGGGGGGAGPSGTGSGAGGNGGDGLVIIQTF